MPFVKPTTWAKIFEFIAMDFLSVLFFQESGSGWVLECCWHQCQDNVREERFAIPLSMLRTKLEERHPGRAIWAPRRALRAAMRTSDPVVVLPEKTVFTVGI